MPESSAQAFLKEQGLIQNINQSREQLLGCLGCRWAQAVEVGGEPVTYGYAIMQCLGKKSGYNAYPFLQNLEDLGLIESVLEDPLPEAEHRPRRRLLRPTPTELGQSFAASLVPPTECRF